MIYVIGGTGMVGTQITKTVNGKAVSRSTGVDATKPMPFLQGQVVINCVGYAPYKLDHDATIKVIKRIIEAKPKRIVHISAWKANEQSVIPYLKAKGTIERLLRESNIPCLIIRPKVIDCKQASMLRYLFPRTKLSTLTKYVKDNMHRDGVVDL